MALFSDLSSISLPTAAPPIETQLAAELHELKTAMHKATELLSQIADRISRLERHL